MENVELSIVIPNYNGEAFVQRCLSSLALSARQTKRGFEIIVVDDCSQDRSPAIVEQEFPWVRLLKNARNSGFGATINRGAEAAKGELLILINNDIVVRPDFMAHLIAPFENNERLFGVTAKTINWMDGSPDHLNMTARFEQGLIELNWSDPAQAESTHFLLGGACAVRRDLFLRLGGFNPIFHPIYWEDYDIAYFAMKCGYENIYNPDSLAYHFGKATLTSMVGARGVQALRQRNYFLFTWLNLTDKGLLFSHLLHLPWHLFRHTVKGDYLFIKSFIKALGRLPKLLRQRAWRRTLLRKKDAQILFGGN